MNNWATGVYAGAEWGTSKLVDALAMKRLNEEFGLQSTRKILGDLHLLVEVRVGRAANDVLALGSVTVHGIGSSESDVLARSRMTERKNGSLNTALPDAFKYHAEDCYFLWIARDEKDDKKIDYPFYNGLVDMAELKINAQTIQDELEGTNQLERLRSLERDLTVTIPASTGRDTARRTIEHAIEARESLAAIDRDLARNLEESRNVRAAQDWLRTVALGASIAEKVAGVSERLSRTGLPSPMDFRSDVDLKKYLGQQADEIGSSRGLLIERRELIRTDGDAKVKAITESIKTLNVPELLLNPKP